MDFLNESLSLYLHIPFCRIKCTYCAFNTYVNLDDLIEPFVKALIQEVEIVGESVPCQKVGTVYLGGGTPSLLTPNQIERILNEIRCCFDVLPNAEISMEANPSDLTPDYMDAVRSLGINRLSIGMQSANAHELELFARRHDNDAVVRAVSAARSGGFNNLNLDLIYGIPHQNLSGWETSLKQMLTLQPEHVSLYALSLEEGTPRAARPRAGVRLVRGWGAWVGNEAGGSSPSSEDSLVRKSHLFRHGPGLPRG